MASAWTGAQQPEQEGSWKNSEVCIWASFGQLVSTDLHGLSDFCDKLFDGSSEELCSWIHKHGWLKACDVLESILNGMLVGTCYILVGWLRYADDATCMQSGEESVRLSWNHRKQDSKTSSTHCGCCTRSPDTCPAKWSAIEVLISSRIKTNRRKGVAKQGFHLIPSLKRHYFLDLLGLFQHICLSSAFPRDVLPNMLCLVFSLSGNVNAFLPRWCRTWLELSDYTRPTRSAFHAWLAAAKDLPMCSEQMAWQVQSV